MAERLKIASQGQGLAIVFIHGWGLNSAVWQPCLLQLVDKFQVITVDLPGFGDNHAYSIQAYTLAELAQQVTKAVAKPALYVGWSLGGLVASQIAITQPEQVLGLVTVASSPQFMARDNWPGIKADVLAMFHQQLAEDTEKTISNFLKIQALGSPSIRQDVKCIRDLVMQRQQPQRQVLDAALQILATAQLSEQLSTIQRPFLRLYGQQDSLVPKQVIPLITALAPQSQSYLFKQASHAPFISHQQEFLTVLEDWIAKQFGTAS
ncbi:pimeloyl-[acyl-carrier protein] methyl ester esterase [Colwellia chukchiensis]|uniref:Pimeloyl-[acyl-carrier protein] methyl ester esterase n=1 Tax=Colwellia chukchiensis TaxID=641665 RepID=A0A1H7Q1N2_9GAMM|nr:pimeloyl-ACP methyl ester esterase BioH [Colwellia chukchiensis]SEL41237.1 pimeloyl-[acyl-carrier protein] methyl ester esterase [Colwellia chukchiensis]